MKYYLCCIYLLAIFSAYAIGRPADAPAAAATTASTTQAPGSTAATGTTEASKVAGVGNSMMAAGSGMASSGAKEMSSLGSATGAANAMNMGTKEMTSLGAGGIGNVAHEIFKLFSDFRLK